jgi:hypothetical protein
VVVKKGIWKFARNQVLPTTSIKEVTVKMEPRAMQYFGIGGNLRLCHADGEVKFGALLEEEAAENLQDTLSRKVGLTDY